MARSRRRSRMQNTFKDYLVPIIGWVFIIFLIFNFLWWESGNNNSTLSIWSANAADIIFTNSETEAYIEYQGDVKEQIDDSIDLGTWETLIVKEGIVDLVAKNGDNIKLNKVAELKLTEDWWYDLYSSDAWFTLREDANISMRYANIEAPAGSVLSLTQNEAGSTVYVLGGTAKITNLAGLSTLLTKEQKISISRLNAAKDDIDLSNEKKWIDSYFKGSDWFIENQWNVVLTQKDIEAASQEEITENTITEEDGEEVGVATPTWDKWLYLEFNTLRDEMRIENWALNISWKIVSDKVDTLTINNNQASIAEDRTFSLENLSLPNSINDVVVKTYDSDKNILEKNVYTVYSSAQWASSSTTTSPTTGGTTFTWDATQFSFTAPSASGKFSTSASEVTIRGVTTAKDITKVEVNGFKLWSFNGSTWRYHAFERFKTLQTWSNQYKIDYYGADNTIVFTDYYTIVKLAATQTPVINTATPGVKPAISTTNAETTNESVPEEALFQ